MASFSQMKNQTSAEPSGIITMLQIENARLTEALAAERARGGRLGSKLIGLIGEDKPLRCIEIDEDLEPGDLDPADDQPGGGQ